MKNNASILQLPKRSLWILMAVLCIVFSSASKKLIEQRLAPYLTISQALGKKIKDGSREKRDAFKLFIQSEKHGADSTNPDILFFIPALISLAFLFLFGRFYGRTRFSRPTVVTISALPLYLHDHRLQV